MSRYAIVEDNKVTNLIEWDGNTGTWTPPTGSTMVAIGATEYGVSIGQDYDGTKVVVPPEPDLRTVSESYTQLRIKRNQKLAASDWSQFPDSPLDSTKKAEWATYRQALRDLPANVNDSNVKDIAFTASHSSWPTKPS
tara:strand:- start:269 stop:682 length:414 start_codon:yes stop_codon:yes gene_type:complete